MKILLATGIYPPESGGPATYTMGLASALRSRGHEVMIVTYGETSLTPIRSSPYEGGVRGGR